MTPGDRARFETLAHKLHDIERAGWHIDHASSGSGWLEFYYGIDPFGKRAVLNRYDGTWNVQEES